MNDNCDMCMYQDWDLKTCLHEGPCKGDVQSAGLEHYFHDFTFEELQRMYSIFRKFQLTELLVTKAILCNVIKEWYNGKKGKD